jgi:hypothetical protein
MMHPRKVAHQEYEIALPGLLDSERNESDKPPFFYSCFLVAHHQPAQSSHHITPSAFHQLHSPFLKRQHPHVAEDGGHQQITDIVPPYPPPAPAKFETCKKRTDARSVA